MLEITEYETITEWLDKESNVDLVIPYIKEQIAAGTLAPLEIDALRTRVIHIKKHGHKLEPVDLVLNMFEGSKRVEGSCCDRVK